MRNRLPPYVYRERTRHGRWVFYFRRGKGRRRRLPDDPTSPEFEAAYRATLNGNALPTASEQGPSPRSLRWLVDRYRESAAWRQLASATRRQRERIFLSAIDRSSNPPFAAITQADIQRAVDTRADTPAQANHFLKTMGGCLRGPCATGKSSAIPRPAFSGCGIAPMASQHGRRTMYRRSVIATR